MNPPQSGTSLTEDAVQTIGGRNTRGDKSSSPGRRNEILELDPASSPKCRFYAPDPRTPGYRPFLRRLPSCAILITTAAAAAGSCLTLSVCCARLPRSEERRVGKECRSRWS